MSIAENVFDVGKRRQQRQTGAGTTEAHGVRARSRRKHRARAAVRRRSDCRSLRTTRTRDTSKTRARRTPACIPRGRQRPSGTGHRRTARSCHRKRQTVFDFRRRSPSRLAMPSTSTRTGNPPCRCTSLRIGRRRTCRRRTHRWQRKDRRRPPGPPCSDPRGIGPFPRRSPRWPCRPGADR